MSYIGLIHVPTTNTNYYSLAYQLSRIYDAAFQRFLQGCVPVLATKSVVKPGTLPNQSRNAVLFRVVAGATGADAIGLLALYSSLSPSQSINGLSKRGSFLLACCRRQA